MKRHCKLRCRGGTPFLLPRVLIFLLFGGILFSCAQEKDDNLENSGNLENTNETKESLSSKQNEKKSGPSTEEERKMVHNLHVDFELTRQDLEEMIKPLPHSIQKGIIEKPEHFLECISQSLDLPYYAVVLVDKEHFLSEDYYPDDLVSLRDYNLLLNKANLTLRSVVMPDLLAMVEAARIAGVELPLSSTFRSYSYQKNLWERNVEQLGLEQASRESARPGTSQHQLGTTIDFGSITDAFADTPAGRWLAREAWKYGFSMSYPEGYEELTGYKYESWHFRHITRLGSYIEQEFFQGIQQYYLLFLHTHREMLEAAGL